MTTTARPVVAGIDARPQAQHTLRWAAHSAATRQLGFKIVYAPQFLGSEAGYDNFSKDAKRTAAAILGQAQTLVQTFEPGIEVSTAFAHRRAVGTHRGIRTRQPRRHRKPWPHQVPRPAGRFHHPAHRHARRLHRRRHP